MKKFILSAATAAAALTTLSADQFYVIMKDGSVESYPTEKVDSISFNDPQIAKIMGFNEMAAELVKLKARVAALEAKSGTVDTSATVNASDLKYFVINDKEVEVEGLINGSADVIIPETALVNGKIYTVTSIAQEAFKNQNRIQTVSLPKTLKNIENSAFYGCSSLTSIEIPSGVTSIGSRAFEGCKNLDIVIDNSRSNVECENGVIGVKSLTFTGSPFLFKVMADGGVAVVRSEKGGDYDEIYRQMKSITIPTEAEINGKKYSVTAIGNNAFAYCSNLTSVEIPLSVTSIGSNAFNGCRGLTKLTVPSSVTSIGNSAFSGCKELDVVIDNSRSNVECSGAFNGVKSLTFTGSQFLFKVLNDGGVAVVRSEKGGDYDEIYRQMKSINIPSEVEIKGKKYPVTAIDDMAFRNCNNLESVEIPLSVTSIGEWAFRGCESLTSIEIPSSVTSIGSGAFESCRGLTKLTVPSSVTSIGHSAFYECWNLDVVVDNSRSNVECGGAFNGVKSVTFTGSPLLFRVLEDGSGVELTNSYGDGDDVYPSLKSVKIPSEVEINGKKYPVTSISRYAFVFCHNLTSVEIPSSVTSIGEGAFRGCESLTSIEIPLSVTSIGSEAFYDCFNLTSIEIPSSVTSISHFAFAGCYNLTSVEIPSSVTSIGDSVFMGCEELDVVIDNSKENIPEKFFNGCKSVKYLK